MKKTYTKPVIVIEDFTLSQSIAHNCGKELFFEQATLKYKGQCGWDMMEDGVIGEGTDILWMREGVCTSLTTEDDLGIVCYNNPGGGYNIFNS